MRDRWIEYYITYWYKKRLIQGLGSAFVEMSEPINKENYRVLVDELKNHTGAKELLILNFKEV